MRCGFLPLDGDFINENASIANPDLTPRMASVHKSRIAVVVLVECWIEIVYYYVNVKKLDQVLTRRSPTLLSVDAWPT